jgi:hypothetical protein
VKPKHKRRTNIKLRETKLSKYFRQWKTPWKINNFPCNLGNFGTWQDMSDQQFYNTGKTFLMMDL